MMQMYLFLRGTVKEQSQNQYSRECPYEILDNLKFKNIRSATDDLNINALRNRFVKYFSFLCMGLPHHIG